MREESAWYTHVIFNCIAPQVGIFTTKDLVLRVLAQGLDPGNTSVIRVMTARPDASRGEATLLEALQMMKAGRYLHMPVVEDGDMPVGLVDVQSLTIAVIEYLFPKDDSLVGEAGPVVQIEKFLIILVEQVLG